MVIPRPHFPTSKYSKKLANLRSRRIDPQDILTGRYQKSASLVANEAYNRLKEGEAVKYAIGSMSPIDQGYTDRTYAEGDRVKNQLQKAGVCEEFEYQGSVACDIHIRHHSDLDLLTICGKFISLDPDVPCTAPYTGNQIEDLKELRHGATNTLRDKFPEAAVDSSRPKSVSIQGGSLSRKIDVVAANWHDTKRYCLTGEKRDRGIKILNAKEETRILNFPFLHQYRINDKDLQSMGGLRKTIRLLKCLKYDAEGGELAISSYDVACLAYNMSVDELTAPYGQELLLVDTSKRYLDRVAENAVLRDSLMVPNGTRRVFGTDGATLAQLNALRKELNELHADIVNDLASSSRLVQKAIVRH